jgi:hypothetical protein
LRCRKQAQNALRKGKASTSPDCSAVPEILPHLLDRHLALAGKALLLARLSAERDAFATATAILPSLRYASRKVEVLLCDVSGVA